MENKNLENRIIELENKLKYAVQWWQLGAFIAGLVIYKLLG